MSAMFGGLADLSDSLPPWSQDFLAALLAGAGAVAVAFALHWVVFRVLRRLARASDNRSDNIVVKSLYRPTRWVMLALALVLVARDIAALEQSGKNFRASSCPP